MKAIKRILSLVLVLCLMLSLCAFPTYADTDAEESSPLDGISSFFEKYIIGFGNFIKSLFDQAVESPSAKPVLKTLLARVFDDNSVFKGFIANIFGAKKTERFDTDKDGTIKYVSLGASNTNGYGLYGYLPDLVYEKLADYNTSLNEIKNLKNQYNVFGYKKTPAEAYPYKLANELKTLTGLPVELSQMAMSSMRVEEIRVLLDNSFSGDAYTDWRFTDGQNWFDQAAEIENVEGLDGLRQVYQETIAAADIVTLDIGVNNFGVFMMNHSMFDVNFDYIVDTSIYFADYRSIYYSTKDLIEQMFENEDEEDSTLKEIAGAFAYAFVGYCMNFDAVVQRIYQLNPDVILDVVNIQNIISGLMLDYDGIEIPFGDIYGALIDLANTYTAVVSPFHCKYNYTYLGDDGQVELFKDELLSYNGNPTTLTNNMKDCFDLYDNSLYIQTRVRELLKNHPQRDAVYPVLLNEEYDTIATILQIGLNCTTVDIDAFSDSSDAEDVIMDWILAALMYTVRSFSDNEPAFDADTQIYVERIHDTLSLNDIIADPAYASVVALGARASIGNSFFAHPSSKGHDEIASEIMKSLKNNLKGEREITAMGRSYVVDGALYGYKLFNKFDVSSILQNLSKVGN